MKLRADRRVGLLLAGVVFLTFVAIGATVALPASDPAVSATKSTRQLSKLATKGMRIYRTAGCWYCHTQEVRTTPVDAPYGKPLGVRAYAGLSPVLLGSERIGPDLAHVGSRYGSAADIMDFLSRPSKSQMPSYGYMSDSDLRALAAYLSSLK